MICAAPANLQQTFKLSNMTPPTTKLYAKMNRKTNTSAARPRKLSLKINIEPKVPPAFWFAREEPEHVRAIITTYEHLLEINKDRCRNSRQPKQFIGKIKRCILTDNQLPNHMRAIFDNHSFFTIDAVNVYERDLVPFGDMFPIQQQYHCLTKWTTDGLPQQILHMTEYATSTTIPSYLYALPDFSRKDDFLYFSSKSEQRVTFGDSYCRFLGGSKCEKTRKIAFKSRYQDEEIIQRNNEEEQVIEEEEHVSTPIMDPYTQDMTHVYLAELSTPMSPCGYGVIDLDDEIAHYLGNEEGNNRDDDDEESWDEEEGDNDDDDDDSNDEESDSEEDDEDDDDSDEEEDIRPVNFSLQKRMLKRQDTPVPSRNTWEQSFF